MVKNFSNIENFKKSCGYEIGGVWYPRVTRIVDMKAKPALLKFYAKMGYDRAQLISKQSAREGTMVHTAVESLLLGKSPVISGKMAPSIEAFLEFISKKKIKVLDENHIERLVHHNEHRYAGTLDVLAQIGGKFGILDIKTSEGIYRDYNLQTAAYMGALVDEFPDLKTRWILRIDQSQQCLRCGASLRTKGGRKKMRPANSNGHLFSNGFHAHYGVSRMCDESKHDWGPDKGVVELKEITDDWRDDFEAFLAAKTLWMWENKEWLKAIDSAY